MLASEAQRLKTLEGVCANRADYYAYRGLVALQQNQPAVAVEWLERALLLDPQLAGVQVDYARALALSGDKAAAANLARELLNRPDLPATVAAWLPGQYRDWALDEAWVARFSVATLAGYETNLNSAPQNPFITLTLGSGDLQMQLSPQYLARQGAAAQIVASGVVGKETGTDALAVVGQVQARGSNYGDTSYQQADLAVLWHHALEQGGTLLRTDLVSLRYAGQELYQSVRLEPDYEFKPWGVCQPRLGVLYNAYVYPVSPELDGRYVGLVGGGTCVVGENQWRAQLGGGHDAAAYSNRPGGAERVTELSLGWNRPLGRGSVDVQTLWGHIRDDQGYSPLLASGATRDVTHQYLKLEYDHPLTAAWEFLVYGEINQQQSNVSLFSVTDHAIYTGLRWKTPQ